MSWAELFAVCLTDLWFFVNKNAFIKHDLTIGD